MKINHQVIRFIFSGIVNTLVGFTFFCIGFLGLSIGLFYSNLMALLASLSTGYFLSKLFVYRSNRGHSFIPYAAMHFGFYFIFTWLLYGAQNIGIDVTFAWLGLAFTISIFSFILQKFLIFR